MHNTLNSVILQNLGKTTLLGSYVISSSNFQINDVINIELIENINNYAMCCVAISDGAGMTDIIQTLVLPIHGTNPSFRFLTDAAGDYISSNGNVSAYDMYGCEFANHGNTFRLKVYNRIIGSSGFDLNNTIIIYGLCKIS